MINLKVTFYKIAQKWPKIWATFETKFVAMTFKKIAQSVHTECIPKCLTFCPFSNTQLGRLPKR